MLILAILAKQTSDFGLTVKHKIELKNFTGKELIYSITVKKSGESKEGSSKKKNNFSKKGEEKRRKGLNNNFDSENSDLSKI